MRRYVVALAMLIFYTMGVAAQRHGRADSIQNYTRSLRPPNPQLPLQLEPSHMWVYFHLTDLRKMARTTVRVTDPITRTRNLYEGVSLDELVPGARARYKFEVFKGSSWGFRDRRVVSSADLSSESEAIVADTVNGKKLAEDNPFYFVAKAKSGDSLVVKKIVHIKFNQAP